MSKIKVIGVGNAMRGDDAAGPLVARRVRAHAPAGVEVYEASGEGASLMDAWAGADLVLLVDAVRSGAAPGTIHRFDAHAERLPVGFFHYSTHAFSLAEAVELARALGALPPRLIVYGIEGHDYDAGAGLSEQVEARLDEVARRVLQEIAAARPAGS